MRNMFNIISVFFFSILFVHKMLNEGARCAWLKNWKHTKLEVQKEV